MVARHSIKFRARGNTSVRRSGLLPRRGSRNPSWHSGFVLQIVSSESPLETWLLQQHKVDVAYRHERHSPDSKDARPKMHCFTNEHCRNPGDHRIANVPIRPHCNESLGRVPRRERTATNSGEQRNAPGEQRKPHKKSRIPATWAKAAGRVPPIQRVSRGDHARRIHRGIITTTINGRSRIAKR